MKSYLNRKTGAGLVALVLFALIGVVAIERAHGDGAKPDQQQAAAGPEVKIDNFTFKDQTITVPAGTQVTWVNRDDIPHTVVSDDKLFKSKALDTDEKFTYTFSQPGIYKYFCSIHPKMTAEVVVK